MIKAVLSLSLAAALALVLASAAPDARAGLASLVVKGAAVGAGASVGHRVANAAMDAKSKSDKAKQEKSIPALPPGATAAAPAVPARP